MMSRQNAAQALFGIVGCAVGASVVAGVMMHLIDDSLSVLMGFGVGAIVCGGLLYRSAFNRG